MVEKNPLKRGLGPSQIERACVTRLRSPGAERRTMKQRSMSALLVTAGAAGIAGALAGEASTESLPVLHGLEFITWGQRDLIFHMAIIGAAGALFEAVLVRIINHKVLAISTFALGILFLPSLLEANILSFVAFSLLLTVGTGLFMTSIKVREHDPLKVGYPLKWMA